MNDLPDATLLRRYTDEGDDAAFAELVQRYLGLVYHAALRQTNGDTHAAEDVAQTVFTLVARKATSLAQHQTLAGWLHTTTRFTAGRHQRSESRRLRREREAHTMQEISSNENVSTDWERLRPLIDEVLADLNTADRDAVLLRFFSGLSLAEIGARLNVSENAARMRVERALEKLHAMLARRGVASTATALGLALANNVTAAAPAGLALSVTSAALAGATAKTALTVGLFSMKAKTIVLTTTLLLALGATLFEYNQAQEAKAALAAANRDRESLLAQSQARKPAPEAPATRPNPETIRTVNAVTPGDVAKQSPIFAKFIKLGNRTAQTHDARYRAFYQKLGFTAEQSAQFKALVLDNVRHREELLKTALTGDARLTPEQSRAIDEQLQAELLASVRANFGDATAQAMQHYNDTFPLRGPVDEFAKTLFYTNTPLTAAQAEQLIDAVANSERNAQGKIDLDWMVQNDFYGAMLSQSSGILSAPQADALQQLFTQDVAATVTTVKKGSASKSVQSRSSTAP